MFVRVYYVYERSPKKCPELGCIVTELKACLIEDENSTQGGSKPIRASGTRFVSHKVAALENAIGLFGAYLGHLSTLARDLKTTSADRKKMKGYFLKWKIQDFIKLCFLSWPPEAFGKDEQGNGQGQSHFFLRSSNCEEGSFSHQLRRKRLNHIPRLSAKSARARVDTVKITLPWVHRLRLSLHEDIFTRKHKLLFADAPFVYMKTVKTLALPFSFWRRRWKWKLLKMITQNRQLSTCKREKQASVL